MCKGVSLILIMFWSSLLGVCVFHAVLLPLLFFRQSHRLYRRMADALVYSWIIFNTVSAILYAINNVRGTVPGVVYT